LTPGTGGKRRELRVVAGEQDPSTFFFAQLVRDKAWTALAAIVTVPIACQGLRQRLRVRTQMPISPQALSRPAPAAWASPISSMALRR